MEAHQIGPEDAAKARAHNIARRTLVREQADRAGRIAASLARRAVYIENGYRPCERPGCETLVTPGYGLCIPHS